MWNRILRWHMPSSPTSGQPHGIPTEYFTDSYVFNWNNQTFRADLILILPIAVCLGIGLWLHHPATGMIAAGGAMTVGFGAKQSIDESRLLPMLFVTFGMAFAAFLGVVIGHTNFFLVAMAALWGFGYGMLTTREAGYSWVGQQCVVTFLVASAFPASIEAAADRALLIISGGALQILFSAILFRLFGQLGAHLASLSRYIREEEAALRAAVLETAHSMRQRKILNSALPYSLLLAITLGVTTEIYRQPDDRVAGTKAWRHRHSESCRCTCVRHAGRGYPGELLYCTSKPLTSCACCLHLAVRMVILWRPQCELRSLFGLYHRIHRLPALARRCSRTCDCAAPCLMHRIGRLDCSHRETGRNLPSNEPMEEGSSCCSSEGVTFRSYSG
jgi:hypothetical protein